MLFAQLVDLSANIAATSKRQLKTELLAGFLRQLEGEEINIAVSFLCGRTPQGKTGIGYRTVQQASTAAAASDATLELLAVDQTISDIAALRGAGSERRRIELLGELFHRATGPEQQFLSGLLVGEIRQGALEGMMADAIARAAGISADSVRRAAMMAGDIVPVARAVLESGEQGLAAYGVQLFRPLQPMLAQTADDIDAAISELGEAALEYKFDGARVQAHKSGSDVVIFSRGQNDVTAALPEVAELVRALPADSLILDGEAISLQPDGRPQPFQITMRRFGRKLDVERMRAELPLSSFWFDLVYLDGSDLLAEPQSRRFAELQRIMPRDAVIPNVVTADAAAADEFLRQALARGHEGVMAKARDSAYMAGARGQSWLKVKQANTLDLVILAAEWGSGRRKGWLSNLHLGARDTEKGAYAMLGKTFKGLTDEMLTWQTAELLKHEIARDSYTVYVEPTIVAEIAFNEIQISPRYVSGLALRFARVKRYRTDKTPADADTFDTVKRLAGQS